jgi:hypothetical protein
LIASHEGLSSISELVILTFLKPFLEKDDKVVKGMPLSNNTISQRTEEMAKIVKTQLIEKLR